MYADDLSAWRACTCWSRRTPNVAHRISYCSFTATVWWNDKLHQNLSVKGQKGCQGGPQYCPQLWIKDFKNPTESSETLTQSPLCSKSPSEFIINKDVMIKTCKHDSNQVFIGDWIISRFKRPDFNRLCLNLQDILERTQANSPCLHLCVL